MEQILKECPRERVECFEVAAGRIMQIAANPSIEVEIFLLQYARILVFGFACQRNRASFCRA